MELDKPAIVRVLASLAEAELKLSRGDLHLDVSDMDAHTRIRPPRVEADEASWEQSLQVDSIELIGLATRVNEWFMLADSGLEDYLLRSTTLGEWADVIVEARRQGHRDIQVKSSGTTGQASACHQRWEHLTREIAGFQLLLPNQLASRPRRILLLCPAHHIYGFLFGALLASAWDIPVVTGHRALNQVHSRDLADGDIVVGYPMIWDRIAASEATFTQDVLGLCSTGPSRPETLVKLRRQGLPGWMEIYGATETGGIGYRQNHSEAFTLLPHWQRQSERHLIEPNSGRQVTLQDAVQWHGERQLKPLARLDGAVQVGGVNVDPAAVARQLESLDEVARASVRLMNPDEGERLKAYVVPASTAENTTQLEMRLRRWCAMQLSAPQMPKHFRFGPELPSSALGKPADWRIGARRQAAARTPA